MKFSLITSQESDADFMDLLKEYLEKRIANPKIEVVRTATALDIPAEVKKHSGSEIIFVCYVFEKEDFRVKALVENLVRVETETGTKVIKLIKSTDNLGDDDESDEKLAEKYGGRIIELVFGKTEREQTSDEIEFGHMS